MNLPLLEAVAPVWTPSPFEPWGARGDLPLFPSVSHYNVDVRLPDAELDWLFAGGRPRDDRVRFVMSPLHRQGGGGDGGGRGPRAEEGSGRVGEQLILPLDGVFTSLDRLLRMWVRLAVGRNRSHPAMYLRRYVFSEAYGPTLEEALFRINSAACEFRRGDIWTLGDRAARLLRLSIGDAVRDLAYIDMALMRVRPRNLRVEDVIAVYKGFYSVMLRMSDERLVRISDNACHRFYRRLALRLTLQQIPPERRVIDV